MFEIKSKKSVLNLLEHFLMRGGDILFSLCLVIFFVPEAFSRIALVQAWITPLLLLMISPEQALYAQYSHLKQQGRDALQSALQAFSVFAWGKLQLALILTLVMHWWTGETLPLIAWAWLQALGVQFLGPEREFLRLDHRLNELNRLTILLKWGALVLMALTLQFCPDPLEWIWVSQAVAITAAKLYAKICLKRAVAQWPAGGAKQSITDVLVAHLSHFAIWNHLNGVALNFILTLDVWVWGYFSGPGADLGKYSAVLKMVNVSFAIPFALSNWISVQVSRMGGDQLDRKALSQFWVRKWTPLVLGTGVLGGGAIAMGLLWLGPLKWDSNSVQEMLRWLPLLLGGALLVQLSFAATAVMTSQGKVRQQFTDLYLPGVVGGLGIYGAAVWAGGSTTGLDALARANVWVGLWILGLAVRMFFRTRHHSGEKA